VSRTPHSYTGGKVSRDLLRYQLFEEQHGCCHLCGEFMTMAVCLSAKAPSSRFATFDHVLAWSQGGTKHYRNLRLAHRRCNSERGHKPVPYYVENAGRYRRPAFTNTQERTQP
jgi:5-methylcytosine-specific restriction endonuclease McrA